MDEVHIEVRNLSVRYPRATGWALRHLSFAVVREWVWVGWHVKVFTVPGAAGG